MYRLTDKDPVKPSEITEQKNIVIRSICFGIKVNNSKGVTSEQVCGMPPLVVTLPYDVKNWYFIIDNLLQNMDVNIEITDVTKIVIVKEDETVTITDLNSPFNLKSGTVLQSIVFYADKSTPKTLDVKDNQLKDKLIKDIETPDTINPFDIDSSSSVTIEELADDDIDEPVDGDKLPNSIKEPFGGLDGGSKK